MRSSLRNRFRSTCATAAATATAAVIGTAMLMPTAAQAASATDPQYTSVSSYSTTITGKPTDVYYPQGIASGKKLPFALLLQGADVDKSHYSKYASAVASYGFVVVVENYQNDLLGGLYANETEVLNAAAWAPFENLRSASPVKGHLDAKKMTLLGHSYGGVAGLYASSGICLPPFCLGVYVRPTSLKAAAFYGTNSTIASITLPSLLNGVPVALVQGTLDGKALATDTQSSYNLMVGAKRALVSLSGANHYGITNVNNPAGAAADANVPTLAQATAIAKTAKWSALWLKAQLGDTAAQSFIYSTGDAADTNVTVQTAP